MTEQILTSHRPTRQWTGPRSDTLADVLERVLDKGVVIVGDVVVSVLDVELLTLRLRLFIASADTAREMGLDWWLNDPFFSSKATPAPARDRDRDALADENRRLRERLDALEGSLGSRAGTAALPRSMAGAGTIEAGNEGDVPTGQVTAERFTRTRADEPAARRVVDSAVTGRSGGATKAGRS